MRTLLATVFLALLISGSGGCAVTPDMWKQANSRVMEYPHLVGSIAGQADHPAALVVCYPVIGAGMSHDRNFYVLLHLNPDGSPPEPFAAHQHASDLLTADAELGPTHRGQIRDFVFSADDWRAGKQAFHQPQFRKLDDPQGISTIESMRNLTADKISQLAYWPGGTSLRSRFNPTPLPPGSTIIHLPGTQPRPDSDRNANIAEAIALTPVTLLVDAVVDPLGGLVWAVRGDN